MISLTPTPVVMTLTLPDAGMSALPDFHREVYRRLVSSTVVRELLDKTPSGAPTVFMNKAPETDAIRKQNYVVYEVTEQEGVPGNHYLSCRLLLEFWIITYSTAGYNPDRALKISRELTRLFFRQTMNTRDYANARVNRSLGQRFMPLTGQEENRVQYVMAFQAMAYRRYVEQSLAAGVV